MFEHLFEQCVRRVESVLGIEQPGAVNARLGYIHRATQGNPNIAGALSRPERLGRSQVENVKHQLANQRLPGGRTKLGINRTSEFGVLHAARKSTSVN